MTAWFRKELYDSPAYIGHRAVRFVAVGDNEGVLETDNDQLIAALRDLVARRRGGVVEIDEFEYNAKKNEPVIDRSQKLPVGLLTPLDPMLGTSPIKKPTQDGLRVVAAATGSAKQNAPEPPPKPRTDAAANRPAARNPRTVTVTKAT